MNRIIGGKTLVTVISLIACSFCIQNRAADETGADDRPALTVGQLIAKVDGPQQAILNQGPGMTFIQLYLWDIRHKYVAKRKDEPVLLAAMLDQKRPIERRLCLASFLLDLKNEQARAFVVKCLDGEQGETANLNAPFVLVSADDAAEQSWRQQQVLRLIELGKGDNFHDWGWDAICHRAGELKLQQAVDPLMRFLRNHPNDLSVPPALGQIGDKRAIPVLLDTIERGDDVQEGHMYALRKLGAPELPGVLLRHLDNYQCIDLLADLDAKQAIEPLQKLVASSKSAYPKSNAPLALARLSATDKKDLAERLMQIAESASTSEERWSAINHVGPTGQ